MGRINIRVISKDEVSDNEIERFYEIMIHAYAVTEREIWGDDYSRMSREEFAQLIDQEQIIGAWMDEAPVGSIFTAPLNGLTWSFGLFSVDFDFQGTGVGRKLVEAAEKKALSDGATHMELEILRPQNEELEVKKVLHDWYESMGYTLFISQLFEERKPAKAERALKLIQPSVFDCYRKKL